MTSRRHQDHGAATVVAAALLGVLVSVTVATSGVVAVVAGHRRAQSAADLAALAGAAALQDGGDPCGRAGLIARRNGARLLGCQVDGWEVGVRVAARGVRLPGGAMELEARGRAGP